MILFVCMSLFVDRKSFYVPLLPFLLATEYSPYGKVISHLFMEFFFANSHRLLLVVSLCVYYLIGQGYIHIVMAHGVSYVSSIWVNQDIILVGAWCQDLVSVRAWYQSGYISHGMITVKALY